MKKIQLGRGKKQESEEENGEQERGTKKEEE